MKLSLPLSLRAALLAAFALNTAAFAVEIHLPGSNPPTELTDDTVFILDGNISYNAEDAFRGIIFRTGYNMTFQSSGDNLFNLSFDGAGEEALQGINSSGKLLFGNLADISFSNCSYGSSGYGTGGAINLNRTGAEGISMDSRLLFNNLGHVSFANNRVYDDGGAININVTVITNLPGFPSFLFNLEFNNSGNVVFSDNFAGNTGGAIKIVLYDHIYTGVISNDVSIAFNNKGDVVFANNSAGETGGAIAMESTGMNMPDDVEASLDLSIKFNNSGNVSFFGNSAILGGAIGRNHMVGDNGMPATDKLLRKYNGDIIFQNSGDVDFLNNSGGRGGAIGIDYMGMFFSEAVYGSEYYSDASVIFRNSGNVTFSGNTAETGGAISLVNNLLGGSDNLTDLSNKYTGNIIFNNDGNVVFLDNIAQDHGGAILVYHNFVSTYSSQDTALTGQIIFDGTRDITFSGNRAEYGFGGAIHAKGGLQAYPSEISGEVEQMASVICGVSFQNINGSVLFEGNHAASGGGAIYLWSSKDEIPSDWGPMPTIDGYGILRNSLLLSADGGDITFKGNTALLDFDPEEWDEVSPLPEKVLNAVQLSGASAYIDELRAAEGRTITFYDPIVADDDSQETLHINRTTDGREYKGEVIFSGELVDQYITKANDESDADFRERVNRSRTSTIKQDAVLYNGTLHITENASLQTNSLVVNQAELKTTNKGIFRADSVDLNGALMDIKRIINDNSPLVLDTLALSGSIAAWDKDGDLYSASGPLNRDISFAVLSVEDGDALISTLSTTMADDRSENPYGVQGEWTLVWDDPALADLYLGFNDPEHILYATWVKTGFIVDPEKEKDSKASSNALWSSKTNMDTMTRAAMGQIHPFRFRGEKDTRYWAMALGDFTSQGARGLVDGYDYWGGGYSMGADTKLNKNLIGGFGLGQLFGKHHGRSYRTKIDQDTFMGILYASYLKQLNNHNALRYDASFGYGLTSNTMKSSDQYGEYARGKWDNKTLGATFRFNWDHTLSDKWLMTSFIGLEYTSGRQEGFTESGRDPRHFDRTNLRNLSLPIGVSFTRDTSFAGGQVWTNSLELSYVPDVYRENPGSPVHFAGDDTRWYAAGINPARNAGRVEWSSRFHFNRKWAMFASYQVDFRDRGCYQSANLGLSVGF